MTKPNLQLQIRKIRNLKLMLTALEADLPKAHQAYATLAPDGYGTGRPDGPSSPGEHSDPTGDALANFEDIDELMVDIDLAIDGLAGTARVAWQDITKIAALITERAHDVPPGQGWCRAHCGHWCPGTQLDRLRSGLCNPCDTWSRRNGRPDIAVVQGMRRGHEGNCQCDDCKHLVVTPGR